MALGAVCGCVGKGRAIGCGTSHNFSRSILPTLSLEPSDNRTGAACLHTSAPPSLSHTHTTALGPCSCAQAHTHTHRMELGWIRTSWLLTTCDPRTGTDPHPRSMHVWIENFTKVNLDRPLCLPHPLLPTLSFSTREGKSST